MPKFYVYSSETVYYITVVEADNEEEAMDKVSSGEVEAGQPIDGEDFGVHRASLIPETKAEASEEELEIPAKYYALFMNGDAENEITFHFTRKEAEEHLLKRASEDNINADTYYELERIMEDMLLSGDQTARIEIDVFKNWSAEFPNAIS